MTRTREVLHDYFRFNSVHRVNDPQAFIDYLKKSKYPNGELDGLPEFAIVLHDSRIEEFLQRLGFPPDHYRPLETGVTDPNLIYVVSPGDGRTPFILNRGMPGAGGVATQTAELAALGVRYAIHVGTCGLIGDVIPAGSIVIGTGSYSDGGAVMLAHSPREAETRIVRSDDELTGWFVRSLSDRGVPAVQAIGYTVPIFYLQPADLIRALIDGSAFPGEPRMSYFEMEQASFFRTCAVLGVKAASLVVGSDRYFLKDGVLSHRFEDDVDQDDLEERILAAAIDVFTRIQRQAEPQVAPSYVKFDATAYR